MVCYDEWNQRLNDWVLPFARLCADPDFWAFTTFLGMALVLVSMLLSSKNFTQLAYFVFLLYLSGVQPSQLQLLPHQPQLPPLLLLLHLPPLPLMTGVLPLETGVPALSRPPTGPLTPKLIRSVTVLWATVSASGHVEWNLFVVALSARMNEIKGLMTEWHVLALVPCWYWFLSIFVSYLPLLNTMGVSQL